MKTVLLDEVHRASFDLIQNLNYSFSSQAGEELGEFAAGHVWRDREWALQGHGAGIQSLVHTDYGDAALGLACHYGPFDRGGAAVLRQERGVDVPGAFAGRVQGIGAQYLAVGGDDEGVVRGYLPGHLGYAGGLAQGEVKGAGELRHGRRLRTAAPTFSGVGLGDDEAYLVVGGDEAAQDGGGEVGSACEGYLQGMAEVSSGR